MTRKPRTSTIILRTDCLYRGTHDVTEPYFCTALRTTIWHQVIFYLVGVCSLGMIPLIMSHFPKILYSLRYRSCGDPLLADYFLIHSLNEKPVLAAAKRMKISHQDYFCVLPRQSRYGQSVVSSAPTDLVEGTQWVETVLIEYSSLHFLYDDKHLAFFPLTFDVLEDLSLVHTSWGKGVFDKNTLLLRRELFGSAELSIPVQSVSTLLCNEVFHAFFVFQVFAIALWLWDEYYQYAGAVIFISLVFLAIEIYCIRKFQNQLRRMIQVEEYHQVLRQHGPLLTPDTQGSRSSALSTAIFERTATKDLVPGDVVVVEKDMVLMCDMLLLQGYAFLNESILSGETVPVPKSALPYNLEDVSRCKYSLNYPEKSILYAGSTVVNIRNSTTPLSTVFNTDQKAPLALVLRTGFATRQGIMLRSILNPPHCDRLSFKDETLKFLIVLSLLTTLGALATFFTTWSRGVTWTVIIIRTLDTFTNGIPPSLSAIMSAGCTLAVIKLKLLFQIHCLDPSRINLCGQVNTIVFDKTGTLTDDSLKLNGFLTVLHSVEDNDHKKFDSDSFELKNRNPASQLPALFQYAVATCHSVVMVDTHLCGDPMEVNMLQSLECTLLESALELSDTLEHFSQEVLKKGSHLSCLGHVMIERNSTGQKNSKVLLKVFKVFEFYSSLQRMSVVVWDTATQNFHIFVKGSPETLRARCVVSSLPRDYQSVLDHYTEQGRRVLAFAYKPIHLDNDRCTTPQDYRHSLYGLTREMAETELHFLGFAVFTNELQTGTQECLMKLRQGGCRCLMATGDNARTALAVARATCIVPTNITMTVMGDVVKVTLPSGKPQMELRWFVIKSNQLMGNSKSKTYEKHEELCHTTQPNGYTTSEFRDLLEGHDPRHIAFLLTGEAFNYLKEQNDKLSSGFEFRDSSTLNLYSETTDFLKTLFKKYLGWFRCHSHVKKTKCFSSSAVTQVHSTRSATQLDFITTQDRNQNDTLTTIFVDNDRNDEWLRLEVHRDVHDVFSEASPSKCCSTDGSLMQDVSLYCSSNQGMQYLHHNTDRYVYHLVLSWFEFCLRFARVYARMSPDDKLCLVRSLRSLSSSPVVAMCGDSSNDALALRGADVGLSLSDKEVSIVAPFTCQQKSIQALFYLLKESRGALVNSLQCFKFITLYASLQLFTTLVLYHIGTNLTDSQYVWIDLCTIIPLSFAMAMTNSASFLSNRLPLSHVICFPVVLSLIAQIFFQIFFTTIALIALKHSNFFTPFQVIIDIDRYTDSDLSSFENTVIFLIYNAQNIILGAVMSGGEPWREPITRNIFLMILLFTLTTLAILLIFFPQLISFLNSWLWLVHLPLSFRCFLFVLVCLDFIGSFYVERYLISWATRLQENKERPAFEIDHIIPLNPLQKVCFA